MKCTRGIVMRKVMIKEGTWNVAIAVVFALFFIWVGLSALQFAPIWFSAVFLSVPILVIVIALSRSSLFSSGLRHVSSLFNSAEVSGDRIILPEEVEYETGRISLDGYWTYSYATTPVGTSTTMGTRRRYYRTRRSFRASKRGRGMEIQFPSEPFRVEILGDGTGTVEAPAVRILSDPYRDALLIFLTDEGEVSPVGSTNLTLSKGNDVAQISLRGEGRFLAGTVQAELSRARKVRIEVGSGNVWRKVAEGQNFEFRLSTLPEEKIVVFAHYKTASPLLMLKKLWKGPTILGHGSFDLKAVLDIPFGKDVTDGTTFNVDVVQKKPEENEKKSGGTKFERGWGFKS